MDETRSTDRILGRARHNDAGLTGGDVLVGWIASAWAQFAVEKGHQDLRGLFPAVEEGCVVSTGQACSVAVGGPKGRAECGLGWGDAVVPVGEHKDWAAYPRGESAGPVEAHPDRRPGGDALLPPRVAISGVKRCSGVEGVRCGDAAAFAEVAVVEREHSVAGVME